METTADIAAYEALRAEHQSVCEQLTKAQETVAQLAHELAQLKRLIFGTRSERFVPEHGPDQLPLFEGASAPQVPSPEKSTTVVTATRAPKKPVRQALPSHLPREVIVTKGRRRTSRVSRRSARR